MSSVSACLDNRERRRLSPALHHQHAIARAPIASRTRHRRYRNNEQIAPARSPATRFNSHLAIGRDAIIAFSARR